MSKKPKILILDTETAPKTAFVWGLFQQNVGINQLAADMYVLDWSAKWLDDEYVYSDSLHYHKLWDTEPDNDRIIVQSAWEMLDEADIVVGHNIDGFDIKTLNGRFLYHGISPPSHYQTIDTLKIARRRFKLTSNKLDFIAQMLGVGEKVVTGGFSLWADIIVHKCRDAFDRMVTYCEGDVWITEAVYKKLQPWNNTTTSLVVRGQYEKPECNACGSSKIHKRGFYHTKTQSYQQYVCVDCGHCLRSKTAEKSPEGKKKNQLVSI